MRKFPQRYFFFASAPSGCCDAAAASADVAALGQLQVSCEKQERERDSLEKGAVIGKKERIRKQWRKQRQQQEMEVEQEAGSKSWLDGFRLVFVFLITHQFHLLNLRISISFLPAPPSHSLFFLSLSLCGWCCCCRCCLFWLVLYRRHFCCLLAAPSLFSVCLFVCVFVALSLIVTSNCFLSLPTSLLSRESNHCAFLSHSSAVAKLFTKWNCFRINNFIKIKLLILFRRNRGERKRVRERVDAHSFSTPFSAKSLASVFFSCQTN